MAGFLGRWCEALAGVGATPSHTRRLAKQIRASNIIGVGFALVSVPSFLWLGSHAPSLVAFLAFATAGYLSPLVLNRLGFHRWARAMPLLIGSLVISVVTSCLGLESRVQLCLFLMAVLPFVVFDIRDIGMLLLLEAVPLGMMLVLLFFPVRSEPLVVLGAAAMRPLAFLATISAFVPASLLLGWFYFDNQRNEDELRETVSSLNREIGERQRIEADLVEALRAAEKGVRAKSEFVAIVSHELRTPLNGVMGMTSLLRGTALDREQADMVDNIDTSGRFLLGLINDILELSKLDVSQPRLARLAFSPEQLFEETVVALAPLATEKGLDLAFRFHGPTGSKVNGDPARLRQVLTNFLGNALKFTEQGFVKVTTRLVTGPGGSAHLACEVCDTGVGVPPGERERIFEPFTQLDASLSRKRGGTGLGLAISRRLVEEMQGKLGVETRPGGGSVFWFEVPLEVASLSEPGSDVAAALAGVKVALIAKSPALGPVLREWLEEAGALLVDESRGDVVLLDAFGRRAEDLARVVRGAGDAKRPVVVLSSEGKVDGKGRNDVSVLPRSVLRRVLLEVLRDPWSQTAVGRGEVLPVPVAAAEAPERSLRALVVEDNVVNQKVAVGMLKRLGVVAEIAENGKKGVDTWAAGSFNLIFMDLQMPVMDGLEAAREIRSREAGGTHVPIVAVSANASPEDEAAARQAGMDGFLPKPLQGEALRRAVEQWAKTSGPRAGAHASN